MNQLENNIAKVMMQDSFDIHVRNAGNFRFPPAYRFERHNHKEMEVNYIKHGSCIIGINGEFHSLKRGDCIVIYPGVPHQFIVDTRENCRITQLEFTVNVPDEISSVLPFLKMDVSYLKMSECESINYFMDNLCRIFIMQRTDEQKNALLHLGFFQLFIDISEQITRRKTRQKKGKAGRVDEIITYFNENYEKEINMEELARQFGMSSRYIRKCFQQETGMSCQKYLSTLRVARAKELLWFSSKSATEIALETGFGSSQYFCRIFQQYTEMTPIEYRNLWKGQKAEELCVIEV